MLPDVHSGGRRSADLVAPHGDQGNDDLLLVVEVAQHTRAHGVDDVSQRLRPVARVRSPALNALMEGDGGLEQAVDVRMNNVMVAVEQVDPMGDTGLHPPEDGEILTGFDPVMSVQMLQELLHRGDQAAVQAAQIRLIPAPVVGDGRHMRMMAPEIVMDVQPEAGRPGQGRFAPAGPGIVGQKHAHVVRQARARAQVQGIAARIGPGRLRQRRSCL